MDKSTDRIAILWWSRELTGEWTAAIPLNEGASRIDLFSNHGKKVNGYPQHLSSPFTRVELSRGETGSPNKD